MNSSPSPPWKGFADLPLIEPTWLIDQIIPEQSTICLYGTRSLGKTFLTLDLALSIATGEDWFGQSVKHGRVLYLLAERVDGLGRRIRGWGHRRGYDDEKLDNLLKDRFVVASRTYAIDKRKEQDNLLADVDALIYDNDKIDQFDLIIADPLISYATGSENDARDMQKFVEGTRRLSRKLNCSLLLVHHAGKQTDLQGNYYRGARGSSALEAAMDTVIELKRTRALNKEQVLFSVTKQREYKELEPHHLVFKAIVKDGVNLGKFPDSLTPASDKTDAKKVDNTAYKTKLIIDAFLRLKYLDQEWAELSEILPYLPKKRGYSEQSIRIFMQNHPLRFDEKDKGEGKGNKKIYRVKPSFLDEHINRKNHQDTGSPNKLEQPAVSTSSTGDV